MKINILLSLCLCICFSCNPPAENGAITFNSCSGTVVMDYDFLKGDALYIAMGPEAHLFIEVCNRTKKDTIWPPQYFRGAVSADDDSEFQLIVAGDTLHLATRGFMKIPKGRCYEAYETILPFKEVEEEGRRDFISDSTYYFNKLASCLEKGQVIFRDYKNDTTIHIPKSPDFKISYNLKPLPVKENPFAN